MSDAVGRSSCGEEATIPVDFRGPMDYLCQSSPGRFGPHFITGRLLPRVFHTAVAFASAVLLAGAVHAQGFKFSNPDPSQQAEQQAEAMKQDHIAYELSTPCRNDLKGKKIMVVI